MIFRQLFDNDTGTYTYLLAEADAREAVLIDPVFEQARRDAALIGDLALNLRYTLDTHVHADHVTGAWLHKTRLGSQIALSKASGAEGADLYLSQGERVHFGRRFLEVRATPGHTRGCLTYILDDQSMAFTGDCLLIRGCGRTDFQQGSAHTLYRSVHDKIFSLPDHCLLYPGHDYRGLTVTSVAEERRYNPRLGGELSEADFALYMENLGLDHPKKLDIAVPANLQCGRPEQNLADAPEADWGPVQLTFAGIWEITPAWVEEHLDEVQIVDVREPDEFNGPLGHIKGAQSVPLGALSARTGEISKDKPIVTVCRAGGRSAQASLILRRAGFEKVANLAGGMLRWRADGLAVVSGAA